jgi:putative spermidine/putrescine transport system substrate-binding protein
MKLHRRGFLAGAGSAALTASVARRVRAQGKGTVTVCSWGGAFMDAQREAFFKPFQDETGIEVVETTTPEFAKIRAMVESGNTEWDVVNIVPSDYLALVQLNMLEPLAYDRFDKAILDGVEKSVVFPYGIGNDFYSEAIAFSTKAFGEGNRPQNWVDVWDVERFPGPRMLYSAEWVIRPNEGAIMATGVPMDKVYPLNLEASYESLSKIRPHVAKWANTPAMPVQALVDGEAVIVQAPANRIQNIKEQGAKVDYVWNQALTQYDLWSIPKGAKNYDNALRFIEFCSRPDRGAALAMIQPVGPVTKASFGLLPPERAAILPGSPENADKFLLIDSAWWAQTDASGKTNVELNVEMWNRWALQ